MSRRTEMVEIGYTLQEIVEQAGALEAVRKEDLRSGDRVLVTTRNSVYTIWVLNDDEYWVAGGWFGPTPQLMTINGCTWGGSAIKNDVVAAVGLHLEFGNRILTTRIRQIHVVRAQSQTAHN